jgi:hypothetical protein
MHTLQQAQLDEKLDNIRGAVTMGYPQGLPPFDPVRLAIEGDKAGIQISNAHILNLTYQRNSQHASSYTHFGSQIYT